MKDTDNMKIKDKLKKKKYNSCDCNSVLWEIRFNVLPLSLFKCKLLEFTWYYLKWHFTAFLFSYLLSQWDSQVKDYYLQKIHEKRKWWALCSSLRYFYPWYLFLKDVLKLKDKIFGQRQKICMGTGYLILNFMEKKSCMTEVSGLTKAWEITGK